MVNIAIDGPAGAGKSSIAKAVSKQLGYIYVDTGALYRAIALNAVKNDAIDDVEKIKALLKDTKISLKFDENGTQCVILNGEDVSSLIRTPEISMMASSVSKIPEVRAFLLDLQRDIAKNNNVIMDGRDIGTVVLPNADFKIFLTASAECRAQRRYKEHIEKGEDVKYEDILDDVNKRDYQDSHRDIAPLKPSEDSVIVDTTKLNFDESVEAIINVVSKKEEKTKKEPIVTNKCKDVNFKFDYTTVKSYKFYSIMKNCFGPLMKLTFKLKYKGLENIPTDKSVKYILAINHTSNFDPVLVSLPKKLPPLHFMAKEELFKNPIVGWVIKHLNGFPVRRGKGDTTAVDFGKKIVEEGHIMAICPEGKRHKDKNGVPQRAKAGVAVIAKATNAQVLPVAIYCDGPIKFGKSVTITYGKPLTLADMSLDKDDVTPRDIKAGANKVMDTILSMWEAEKNEAN